MVTNVLSVLALVVATLAFAIQYASFRVDRDDREKSALHQQRRYAESVTWWYYRALCPIPTGQSPPGAVSAEGAANYDPENILNCTDHGSYGESAIALYIRNASPVPVQNVRITISRHDSERPNKTDSVYTFVFIEPCTLVLVVWPAQATGPEADLAYALLRSNDYYISALLFTDRIGDWAVDSAGVLTGSAVDGPRDDSRQNLAPGTRQVIPDCAA